MFRPTSAKSTRRLYHSVVPYTVTTRRAFLTGRFPTLPCVSTVDPFRFPNPYYSSSQSPPLSLPVRSLHYAVSRPPLSQDISFNLLPLYNSTTLPNNRLLLRSSHLRIGLRFMNSDSNKKPPPTSDKEEATTATTSTETSSSSSSSPNFKPEHADKHLVGETNPALKGLVDSVDNKIQHLWSRVNLKEFLQYFSFVVTFGLLVVGPIAVRYVLL